MSASNPMRPVLPADIKARKGSDPLVVLTAFALGCGVAALAGIMNGIYYNEINFSMGLLLGAIGFSAAVIIGEIPLPSGCTCGCCGCGAGPPAGWPKSPPLPCMA